MALLRSTRIPYVLISVEIPEIGMRSDFEALLDTGFNADLVVPRTAIRNALPALLRADVRLADGSRLTVPMYLGNVTIAGVLVGPVSVMSMGDEAIIGLNVITRFELRIDHDREPTMEP